MEFNFRLSHLRSILLFGLFICVGLFCETEPALLSFVGQVRSVLTVNAAEAMAIFSGEEESSVWP